MRYLCFSKYHFRRRLCISDFLFRSINYIFIIIITTTCKQFLHLSTAMLFKHRRLFYWRCSAVNYYYCYFISEYTRLLVNISRNLNCNCIRSDFFFFLNKISNFFYNFEVPTYVQFYTGSWNLRSVLR